MDNFSTDLIKKNIDYITEAYNLDYIINLGNSMLNKGESISIFLLNIDSFKQINHTFGYFIGNSVLNQVSNALEMEFTSMNGIIGRLGGDEFIILFRNISNKDLNKLNKKLINLFVKKRFKCDSDLPPIQLSCSIGMASSADISKIDMQELLRLADIDMYYKKEIKTRGLIDNKPLPLIPKDIERFIRLLKEKDIYSYIHSQYVMAYSINLAKELNLPDTTVTDIYIGAWIHDVGKILTPINILRKHGPLSDEEYSIIKKHVTDGLLLVSNYQLSDASLNCLKYHHERFDGKGYPYGLLGKNTPIEGKIIQIADAFSAMTIKRVYRDLISPENALKELVKNKNTQFDPDLVDVFVKISDKSFK